MIDEENILSPTKRALLAIQQLQAKIEALEKERGESIAIVGMGCRLPGGVDNPDAFWQLLQDGVDAIEEVPASHWDINEYYDENTDTAGTISNRYGGFLPHLDAFDAQFFRISPREAIVLDPQQRLLLEVAWEALENAAIASDRLVGTATGVFIGICSNDRWHQLLRRKPTEIDAYLATGNAHSMAAGRLSYLLGLQGASMAVDTACSSSLVAVHLAVNSLRNRECDTALAGGVNRLLLPEISINFSRANMLSPEGRCKTFDRGANGFVRAEGCGIIVLKRLGDAIVDRDNILAVIRGSAVNHDGRSSGLTVPNGTAQQAVIRQALGNANLNPIDIDYIETHGTGTALGDPIEVSALEAVFAGDRSSDNPLILGSVKTNIGHAEAAAGIASLIKVILALQKQEIPRHLHLQTPNPHIKWENLPFILPTQPKSWQKTEKTRIAGVSSFGFSGTNAHIIVAESPDNIRSNVRSNRFSDYQILTLSAKTSKALTDLVDRYQNFLQLHPDINLGDLCFTANIGRSQFDYRLAIITDSIADLRQQLAAVNIPKQKAKSDRASIHQPQPTSDRETLNALGQLYREGLAIDWQVFYDNCPYCKIVLPNYPFQRQSFPLPNLLEVTEI
jgi:3-oxoacyl-[acyl-carrier-protein] synthase II